MRKHDVRKWLHAILDLLPVIIIPVFMIYSHRHTIDTYAIDVPQNEIVDFNQLYDYEVAPSQVINGITYENLNNGSYHIYGTATDYADFVFNRAFAPTNEPYYLGGYSYDNVQVKFSSLSGTVSNDMLLVQVTDDTNFYLRVEPNVSVDTIIYPQIFNLTQMFGSGNEPTTAQFKSYFPNEYYEYTTSKKVLLNVGTITYDDTDIGSQMLYCLYNSVDKYFNLNNVFGFNNVYDWLSLNIFNGNPPIAIYIVWNIALYEFLMDLIMLLYALFMWFIDMCEHLIDRSFHVASGRKK